MDKLFISCEHNFPKQITRTRAKGYKSLLFDDNMSTFSFYDATTMDTNLKFSVRDGDFEPEAFTVLCKEFGLDGYKKFTSDISIIFLDNGYMLVTLYKGAIALNIEDEEGNTKLLAPSLGVDSTPSFNNDSILWVSAEDILSYSKYFNEYKNIFLYDFEFFFTVSGSAEGTRSFMIKPKNDEDIDISLGYYAKFLDSKQKRKEAKRATNLMKMFNSSEMEFEDEDDYEIDSDDDDDIDY